MSDLPRRLTDGKICLVPKNETHGDIARTWFFLFRIVAFVAVPYLAGCDTAPAVPEAKTNTTSFCDKASFGSEKIGLCAEGHCPIPEPPKELTQIKRGIYLYRANTMTGEWEGWTGIDMDLGRSVSVERYAGAVMGDARSIIHPTDTEYVREFERSVEIVSITPLEASDLDKVSCSANGFWTDMTQSSIRMYDFTVRIVLLDGHAIKVIGGEDEALSREQNRFADDLLSKFRPAPSPQIQRLKSAIIILNSSGWYRRVGDRLFFETGSAALNAQAKELLDRWAFFLTKNYQDRLTVEGHTDDLGSDNFNRALGLKRANAVRDYLTAKGIDASRIKTVSYGKNRPAVLQGIHGDGDAARAQNRRAVGVIE